jgi:two-component system, NarL family, nitrate/nitrite response regulator NarL
VCAAQTVLVVDDHPVVRRGFRTMLEGEPWVGTVLEAADAAEALRIVVTHEVHVVAMDIGLPGVDGVAATRQIVRARPDVKILMFTMTEDQDAVDRALRAGARGYVLKSTKPETLIDSLRAVAGGGVVLGPTVGVAVLAELQRVPAQLPPPFDRLTHREQELLAHLVGGSNNARIARSLGVAEKTVRNQLSAVFAKIGASDRVQAVLLAQEAGLAPSVDKD